MDGPREANSGHPGTAMALAPLAYALWGRIMRFDPAEPHWPDRDRFVLSCGHASILQYSMLHLCGYGVTLDDLRAFRQWGSRTPGHPEVHHTPGIEVTTGPLGQGIANAVGLAMAEEHLRARFGSELFDHHTFAIASDGDLMEGISHEAASLAGHQALGRLVVVYDDNHITIDGPTELALTDDAAARFAAYGWDVHDVGEIADDVDALEAAVRAAMDVTDRPSLVVLRSHIGTPSPEFTDTAAAHGSPFPPEEIARTKELMGLPPDETFHVPPDVAEHMRTLAARGAATRAEWEARLAAWDGDREVLDACLAGRGLTGWYDKLPTWQPGEKVATRNSSKACLNAILDGVPGLLGGGADLTGNTGVAMSDTPVFDADNREGRLLHFGVREHAMGAAMNGMALHGGVLPIGGTFFIFSDYMRPAVRLAALSEAHVIYSWSHDSVGVGEDGPTHQPIEQLAALRAIPGLCLVRPADANESAMAWRVAVERSGPVALVLSRQNLPVLDGTAGNEGVLRGAYVLVEPDTAPAIVLLATGSEVWVARDAAAALQSDGVAARVVSMPSWELFEEQDAAYRDEVLPAGVPVLSVEAGSTFGWCRWADDSVGIDRFGASAPGSTVLAELGMTPEHVTTRAKELLARSS
ncbi:MAG: transketolase [Acidimicrobiia bacterium]|nr:transketolase [Acidimicrobiia bacterium]